ncbi:MAG TPA: ribbon-helix-helix domain-containing protein [Candidatus Thermoplasmatota archaeon]|nr:ribbon-helix-helix domain-containing protein [Candidatus Thermoplasmatota archaeon]
MTVRISARDLADIDVFVSTGEFRDRSDLIRKAIKDYLNSRAKEVLESMKARQALVAEAQAFANNEALVAAQKEAIEKLTRK